MSPCKPTDEPKFLLSIVSFKFLPSCSLNNLFLLVVEYTTAFLNKFPQKNLFVMTYQLVSILLKHGANPLQTNLKGKTPVDVAHDSHIEKLLRREIISSNSDASSADYIRSPTSPESLASIKDEDRMMEVEGIFFSDIKV